MKLLGDKYDALTGWRRYMKPGERRRRYRRRSRRRRQQDLRGLIPTPYQRGFEDTLYNKVYCNPYRINSPQWIEYNQGNEDARKAAAAARP